MSDTLETQETLVGAELEGEMLRGPSFANAYDKNTKMMKRLPTMLNRGHSTLIPRLKGDEEEKLLVVFDLDETIVYARDGPLMLRPHAKELLKSLEEVCEIAFWTAGVRTYAKAIVMEIEKEVWGKSPAGVIKHCISRNKNWFSQEDYTKDLRKLGRDMDKVLIIENTPDCVRLNPENAIIVQDFEGERDTEPTLAALLDVILELVDSGKAVPDFIPECGKLERQSVKGVEPEVFFLTAGKTGAKKILKANRDKKRKAEEEKKEEEDAETEEMPQEEDEDTEEQPPKKKERKTSPKKSAKKGAKQAARKK
eukprot:TRINITY_DN28598_c0_g1_i1.p1 TRINITY_DN28598_c0_g1~~TRINITY_DN28598_c0_g1_i1.p1  ORF type:complete len:324 (+),score=170.92 TRINITY_DN28598_c0_g1_i1:45-974(+)